jgi:hypothetical protein
MSVFRLLFTSLTLCSLLGGKALALDWIEDIDGDLSGVGATPTFLSFTTGINVVEGTMGWNGVSIDQDIWSFTIASGMQLTGITLTAYNSSPNPPATHYIGIANDVWIDDGFDTTMNLSNADFLWAGSSVNLLQALDDGPIFSGPGFNGPLQAGSYSFLLRENFSMTNINGDPGTGNMLADYTIEFVIAPVPEPGSATLLVASALFLTRRRRR